MRPTKYSRPSEIGPMLPAASASTADRCLELHSFDELPQVLALLLAELRRCGYSVREQFGIRLALEEALANALKHGHKGDDAKTVRCWLRLTPDEVAAEVEDEGAGFNPSTVPDPRGPERQRRPGGRGVFLMRQYMNAVEYNAAGNRVTLRKTRQTPA